MTDKTVSFNCMPFKQAGRDMAIFAASGKDIWNLVQINTRVEDKDEGYQRALSTSRVARIASFIDNKNVLPTSILVSFDHAEIDAKKRVLKVKNRPDAGWVIDGQHRLAGAHRAQTQLLLPVVAFVNLSLDEQIKCFVTINEEAKGVPKSLYYDLLKNLPGQRNEAEIIKERTADLATIVRKDEDSPFFNRVLVTAPPKRGEISLVNFVRKVSPLIRPKGGRLATFSDSERAGILNNYYKGLGAVFPREYQRDSSIFFMTLGFGALMNALPTFLDLTITHRHEFKVADVVEIFKMISHFDFAGWHELGTGSAAEIQAGEDLVSELRDAFEAGQGSTIVLK